MRQLLIKPQIHRYDNCNDFITEFKVGEGDLIITNKFIFNPYFGELNIKADVIFQEKYGAGEPSDEMAEALYADMKGQYKRIIAIGGGTVIDLSKLYALKNVSPVVDLFDRKLDIVKDKELILVPTTCGTGSEVTNISILELKSRHTKLGLAVDELFADHAIMIPQILEGLPYKFFATSSIDALIHAVESSVSPKATSYTKLFGHKAVEMIIHGYKEIAKNGEMARVPFLGDFLVASNYAGIAFGNAGAGAVHAMSYPFGGKYHVAHGEANYTLFTRVFEHYMAKKQTGSIAELNHVLAESLGCQEAVVYKELDKLLNKILPRMPMSEYGVTPDDLADFTENVMTKQGRLMANNFVRLEADDVLAIYKDLL